MLRSALETKGIDDVLGGNIQQYIYGDIRFTDSHSFIDAKKMQRDMDRVLG